MNTLREEILNEMKVLPEINALYEIDRRVKFMKDYLKGSGVKNLVLGISGGQDSTLLGKLAQIAVDELNDENGGGFGFIAVRLPYGVQKDEDDCQLALEFIQPTKVLEVNIKRAVDASVLSLADAGVEISDFVKGNEKARERMKVQYSLAGHFGGLVLGTDHSAESVTGFYTKHGDGACDLVPLFGLNKRQGKLLLKALDCPEKLYLKRPTADLEDDKPQLADEDSLGLSYTAIDDYLEGRDVSDDVAKKIEDRYVLTMHKRELPVSLY